MLQKIMYNLLVHLTAVLIFCKRQLFTFCLHLQNVFYPDFVPASVRNDTVLACVNKHLFY